MLVTLFLLAVYVQNEVKNVWHNLTEVLNKQAFLNDAQTYDKSMQKLKEHLTTNYYKLYKE
ncbi:hypothetical protein [Helicobacter sp. T3_23-1056]